MFDTKKQDSVIMAKTKPSGGIEDVGRDDEHPLLPVAEELLSAVHAKDANGIAVALQAAFDIADSSAPEEKDEGEI